MKTRKKVTIVVAFALMAMIARPQIMFAQAPPTPIRGSWDAVKTVPSGDKVAVRLRSGQTLNGWIISASDTVLTLELRKNSIDVNRGDVLRVYKVVKRSRIKGVLLGLLIGTSVGALLGNLVEPEHTDDPGLATVGLGLLGGLIGTGVGAAISFRTKRLLIYETN
ncbi:MAG TPA: hypothetical protein VI260_30315 [Blastocatellia bacterium]|jgi:hypothetical protein